MSGLDPETTKAIQNMATYTKQRSVAIDYTNWKGERSKRLVIPIVVRWGASVWHSGEQWLMDAFDLGKGDERTFAMKDIHSWEPTKP